MRTKGAKNKPKIEEKPQIIEDKPIIETKPEIIETEIKREPKPEIKETVTQEIKQATATKPKVVKTVIKRVKRNETGASIDLEQIQDPIKTKGLPAKYIALGLLGVIIVVAYFKKDAILEKIVEIKMNRKMSSLEKEFESIDNVKEVN